MGWISIVPLAKESISFDATMSETHTLVAETTDHPVETNGMVTDHIRRTPLTFDCDVYVTNTPIVDGTEQTISFNLPSPPPLVGLSGAIDAMKSAINPKGPFTYRAMGFDVPFDAIQDTYEALKDIWENSIICTVLTSIRDYENMVMVNASLPRNEAGGMTITLSFKQISFVETKSVSAPKPKEPRGAKATNKGAQTAKEPSKEVNAKSFALGILNQVGVLNG